MSTSAMITMIVTQVLVAFITLYFFYKVLTTPPKSPEELEETDNEE